MRKRTICILTSILIIFMFIGYAYFIEPSMLIVKSYTIETSMPIQPTTILFFTDTHFGKHYDIENMDRIVEKINEENADIVFFGGDLIDNYARDIESLDLAYLEEKLQEIHANVGKYAVWGNHDYGGGAVRIYEECMRSGGFTLLKDETVLLEERGIQIFGFDDYLMGFSDESSYTTDSSSYNLILAHEPILSQFIKNDSDNLLLTGHTHGGQIYIPFLSDKVLPEGSGTYRKGFYDAEDIGTTTSLTMYTSSGIGMTILPFRFLNTPEIIKINLQ